MVSVAGLTQSQINKLVSNQQQQQQQGLPRGLITAGGKTLTQAQLNMLKQQALAKRAQEQQQLKARQQQQAQQQQQQQQGLQIGTTVVAATTR